MLHENETRVDTDPIPSPIDPEQVLSLFREQWQNPTALSERMRTFLLERGEPLVERFSTAPLPTQFGDWTHVVYGDRTNGRILEAVVYGNLEDSLGDGENVLVRIHSSHKPNELWNAHTSDDRAQLNESMQIIEKAGKGVIVYLNQEGRGHGEIGQHQQFNNMFAWDNDAIVHRVDEVTKAKVHVTRAYEQAGLNHDARTFHQASGILADLGVTSVNLLTNNPMKISHLTAVGIDVINHTPLHIPPSHPITETYHRAQKEGGYLKPNGVLFNANKAS